MSPTACYPFWWNKTTSKSTEQNKWWLWTRCCIWKEMNHLYFRISMHIIAHLRNCEKGDLHEIDFRVMSNTIWPWHHTCWKLAEKKEIVSMYGWNGHLIYQWRYRNFVKQNRHYYSSSLTSRINSKFTYILLNFEAWLTKIKLDKF